MSSVPAAGLAHELRSLDDEELTAFVADLWAARGFETSIDGTTVSADRGDESLTIQCGARSGEEPIDVLAGTAGEAVAPDGTDYRVLGPDSLGEMLLYAVDRETANRLSRIHLGRSLRERPAATPFQARLAGTPVGQILTVGLVVVITAVMAFGAASGASFLAADESVPTVQPTSPDEATSDPTASATDSGLPAAGGQLFRYPRGLGPSGVTDVDALAAAHRSALANDSWSLRLIHNGSHDLMHPYREWVGSTQVVVRVAPTRYTYQVTGFDRVDNETIPAEIYVDYGDGTANYRRHVGLVGDGFQLTQLPATRPPGVFASLSATYVERYLGTTDTRVETVRVGSTTRQRVIATGTPTRLARTVANYTAVAIVDRQGIVHRLVVEYTLLRRVPDPEANGIATPGAPSGRVPTEPVRAVRFEMVLSNHGRERLTAPGWYDRALNETAGDDPLPWPNDPAI